jgi:hypothetical protein
MKHFSLKRFVIALLIWFLFSCTTKIASPLEFEDKYLNNQILLHVFPQVNSFKTSDYLVINMTFRTDADIVFPNNYNLRLFVKEKSSWKEIYEKPVERLPAGDFIFFPRTSPQMWTIFIEPDLENNNQKYFMRLYVSGKMMDNGKMKTVASFIDVNLKP